MGLAVLEEQRLQGKETFDFLEKAAQGKPMYYLLTKQMCTSDVRNQELALFFIHINGFFVNRLIH